jgi:hypothetical protein
MSIYFISCIDNFVKQLPFIYEILKLGTRSAKRPLMSRTQTISILTLYCPFLTSNKISHKLKCKQYMCNNCICYHETWKIKSFKTYLAHGCRVGSVHQLGEYSIAILRNTKSRERFNMLHGLQITPCCL